MRDVLSGFAGEKADINLGLLERKNEVPIDDAVENVMPAVPFRRWQARGYHRG